MNNLPVIEGDHGVGSVLALDTEVIFISSIDVLLHGDFPSDLVDDNVTQGIGVNATSLLKHTIIDKSTKSSSISSLQIEWIGEEDSTTGSSYVHGGVTISVLNRNCWVDDSLGGTNERSGAVTELFDLPVVVSDERTGEILTLNTKKL